MNPRTCTNELCDYYTAVGTFDERIGILGGTFDPIHTGHIKMGMDAHDEFGLSKVLYIPSGRPPHKPDQRLASDEHRLAMLELAMNQPYMQASRIEIDRKGTTYTVDTMTLLNNLYKEYEFYYIIGSDTLFLLHTWKDYARVLSMTHFIVFQREGDDIDQIDELIDFYNASGTMQIFLANAPGLRVSSTDVRIRLLNGLNLSGHVPDPVIDYIKENQLYTK